MVRIFVGFELKWAQQETLARVVFSLFPSFTRLLGAAGSRRSVQWRLMGLQHHDPSGELRLVVGLHGPQDVSTLVCLMEAVRCGGELAAYAVDLV